MNKLLKVLAASALVATVLVGCGKKNETTTSGEEGAKYAKAGFGMVTTISDGKVNTTMATVGLDKDGKVNYIDVDCAQQDTEATGDNLLSKYEKKEKYGMKGQSPIGKEWNEQIDAYKAWANGKTLEEVANVETMDFHGGKAAKTGSELAAGCTIVIDDIQAAVAKAGENMTDVSADKMGAGEVTTISDGKVNTTTASVAVDKDGKIVWSWVDCAQQDTEATGDNLLSKYEKKEKYGMKGQSPIGKEWNEQIDAYKAWANGKTLEEVANVETMDFHGGKAAKTGSELAAGCTIVIDDIQAAMAEAGETLQ